MTHWAWGMGVGAWGTRRRLIAALCASVAVFALVVPPARTLGADGTSVNLRIEGSAATIFDGTVTVSDCAVTDSGGASHTLSGVALCALAAAAEQSGFTIGVQDFGFGLFVSRIAGDDTPADFSQSWNFWVNDDPSSIGLDTYTVVPQDRILLAFAPYPGVPLRVQSPDEIVTGTSAQFTVERRVGEFDETFTWHGLWEAADGAQLLLGESVQTVPVDGIVSHTFLDAGSVNVFADGAGFVRSARRTLTVTAAATPAPSPSPTPIPSPTPTPTVSPTPSPTPTPIPPASPTPSPSPIAGPSADYRQQLARDALAYLRSAQRPDGTIDGPLVSAWSAMAFGAHDERARDVRAGGRNLLDGLAAASLVSATDVERQILAVRAAGGDPRAFGGQNLVHNLLGRFHDGQLGETALLNDDIFGVLALLAAGMSPSAPEVEQTVGTILQRQAGDGLWENLDLTAAAIQALRAYATRGGRTEVNGAANRAAQYLRSHQDRFGGFGENSATTSWSIQAIVALGEDPGDWRTSDGSTPWTALLRYRNASGGFGWQSNADVSPFMTAYAVPALLGVPWPVTRLSVELVYIAEQTQPSPIPSATPQPSPRIAGATATRGSAPPPVPPSTPQKTSFTPRRSVAPSASPEELLSPVQTVAWTTLVAPPGFTPLAPVDRQFAVTAFAVSNAGIGLALTRIASRLRTFTVP